MHFYCYNYRANEFVMTKKNMEEEEEEEEEEDVKFTNKKT